MTETTPSAADVVILQRVEALRSAIASAREERLAAWNTVAPQGEQIKKEDQIQGPFTKRLTEAGI